MAISTSDVRDDSVRAALGRALDDGNLSYSDTIEIIRATFDRGGVSDTEREDLRRILSRSSTLGRASRRLLQSFINLSRTWSRETAGGQKLMKYLLHISRGGGVRSNAQADRLVLDFMARPGRGAFPRISRREVGMGLIMNVRLPGLINQGPSSLCGPSSLLYQLAQDNPIAYCRFGIGLYERGRARLGRLEITPGSDLRSYDPPFNRIAAADWITAASIRDSENWFFDYQSVDDEFAGITLPNNIASWLRNLGYTRVVNDTNLVFDKDEANARRADEKYRRGYRVLLFINANLLSARNQTSGSASANHWVALTSPMTLTPSSVRFSVFTWGAGRYGVPQGGTLSMSDFLDNYYGYVAGKY